MGSLFTADDILDEIEFELAQGVISRDNLGQSIKSVKQYQGRLRAEIFQMRQELPQVRSIIGRQFQMNDMLLTLLQEMAASLRDLNLKLRRATRRQPEPLPPQPSAVAAETGRTDTIWRDTEEVRAAADTPLDVAPDLRPVTLPLLSAFLQRVRYAAHMLVIFYVRKLGQEQRKVNQTFADWLLYQDALHHYQAEENAHLRAQIADLEKRLRSLELRGD